MRRAASWSASAAGGRPIPRSRAERLLEAESRMQENLAARRVANERYEEYRAQGRMKNGRRFGGPPKPYVRRTRRRGRST